MGPVRGAPLNRYRNYLRHFRGSGTVVLLAAVLLGVSGLLPGIAVGLLRAAFDALVAGHEARLWLAGLIAIAVAQSVLMVVRSALTRRLASSLVHTLRMRVHRRFHEVADPGSVGERLAAVSHEADELQYGVSGLVTALRNPVAVVVLAGGAIWLAPGLAWRAALAIPVLVGLSWFGGWLVQRATREWTTAHRAWLAELQDQHAGLRSSIDLDAVDTQMGRAAVLSATEASARARRDWVRTLPAAFVQLGVAATLVALLATGMGMVREGVISAGDLVAFVAAVALLQRPLTGLSEVWSLIQRSVTALERIELLFAQPTATPTFSTRIRLAGVRVSGRVGPVDLEVHSGEKVAVVGASGSGKSSLLAVLAGHLEASGDVETVPTTWLRQDPWVFDRSVAENLRLADSEATPDAMERVLRDVELDVALDRGLEEAVGERGSRFSGGEAQRLCLARALLSAPSTLLLDESLSEVDPARADRIAAHLADLGATVVFASHDPLFARRADRVIWMADGRIVGQGPHDELVRTLPAYRAFWNASEAAA